MCLWLNRVRVQDASSILCQIGVVSITEGSQKVMHLMVKSNERGLLVFLL